MSRSTDKAEPRFAYEGIDKVIHEKARLSIVASLASHADSLTFNDLKDLCGLTDGNLSRHLAVLQEAGVVKIEKSFRNNKPLTTCKLMAAGRKRFVEYVSELEKVIADAAKKHGASSSLGILPT